MRYRDWLGALLGLALGIGGCVYDPGDCSVHPIGTASISDRLPAGPPLASSCWAVVTVGGAQYDTHGEVTLTEAGVGALSEFGRITAANDAWRGQYFGADPDLAVWRIPGLDPQRVLFGTAAHLRGTRTYTLLLISNCTEYDACSPPLCEFLEPGQLDCDTARLLTRAGEG